MVKAFITWLPPLHCTVAVVSASEAFENFETAAVVEITQKHTLYKVK